MIHAAAALPGGSATKAIEALAPAAAYEFGSPGIVGIALFPIYVRGEAYLAARQGGAAAAEFQKILDHPSVVENEPIDALRTWAWLAPTLYLATPPRPAWPIRTCSPSGKMPTPTSPY